MYNCFESVLKGWVLKAALAFLLASFFCWSQIFAPLLIKDEKWNQTFDPKLQSLLSELQAGLSSELRKADPSQGGDINLDESSFAGELDSNFPSCHVRSVSPPPVDMGFCCVALRNLLWEEWYLRYNCFVMIYLEQDNRNAQKTSTSIRMSN